jgi:TolB-like protein/DNA-binding winged helix-turn-helix (wHTH) protein
VNTANAHPSIYRFGDFEVDTLAHELRRHGERIRLQDQPYQILLLLLERAGKVVTREELRQNLWPSSVFIDFDHGLNNAIARLREALGDPAATPRFIETLPRIGYRFLGPVRAAAEQDAGSIPSSPARASAAKPSIVWTRNRLLIVAAGVAVAVLVAALLRLALIDRPEAVESAATTSASVPSIAVLPFVNMSSNEEDEHFSDGLTEEVVSRLGGIRGLKVVARTSSFRFKGKEESSASIGEALQVNHFLEGSVRRSGERLRITAQLIDARKDEHVWTQTFERDAGDIFQIQEDIALAVAAALKVSLLEADEFRIHRRGTSDPEAYRLYLIGRAHLLLRPKKPDMEIAKRSLDAAIERDPNFAAAHAGIARYYFRTAWGNLADTEEGARLGAAAAARAAALDPTSGDALMARANFEFWRYRFRGDYQAYLAGETDMQRAIELDPANSLVHEEFGRAIFWHEPDLASSLLEQAIELDVLCTGPNILIASLLGYRGQLDAARKRCADLLARFPDAAACRMSIATLDTYFGRFAEAVETLRAIEKPIGGAARIQLWSVHMSMGDRAGARQWLDFGKNAFENPLSDAARFAMEGRYEDAFMTLERHREDYPHSRLLDLPAAKFALIAGRPQEARKILEQRLPDLASGIEPISARNVIPALDLATAQLQSTASDQARVLLGRIAAYLDDPGALRLPMFTVQRARAHLLAGEIEPGLRALDRAYEEGLRTTWALDLRPQSSLYIDPLEADPAFAALRDDPRLDQWFARIRTDNARQLERIQRPPRQEQPVETARLAR